MPLVCHHCWIVIVNYESNEDKWALIVQSFIDNICLRNFNSLCTDAKYSQIAHGQFQMKYAATIASVFNYFLSCDIAPGCQKTKSMEGNLIPLLVIIEYRT